MSTAVRKRADIAARPSALEAFRVRARALLWSAGELELPEAVDELQVAAERDGLVAGVGQDEVQRLMAEAFAAVRDDETPEISSTLSNDAWSAPGWRDAAVEYHKDRGNRTLIVEIEPERLARLRALMADDVSLERVYAEIHSHWFSNRSAASTIEALMFCLRERGEAAFTEPDHRRRLAELSSTQLREVIARLIAGRSRYPAISDDLLFSLGEQL
jgi:hypothetical protein